MIIFKKTYSIIFSFLIYQYIYLYIYSIDTNDFISTRITSQECKTYNTTYLYERFNHIADKADNYLIPSLYKSVINGYLLLVKDESDSNQDGGGTNPFGAYFTILLNSSEIFPSSMCSIPLPTGGERCGINTYATSFILGPNDVITISMCTPPPVKYFSYDVVIDARLTEEYPFYPGQNFGDTISNLDMMKDDTFSNVYDQPVVVIHSADALAASQVSNAYVKYGGDGELSFSSVLVRGIPSSTEFGIVLMERHGNNQNLIYYR